MTVIQNPGAVKTVSRPSLSMLLTLSRVPTGLVLVIMVLTGRGLAGAVTLTVFVAVDVIDGIAARLLGQEDPQRRGMDSIIDRTTIAVVLMCAALQTTAMFVPALVVTATGIVAYPAAARNYNDLGVVLKAPAWHRVWSTTLFLSGLVWFAAQPVAAVAIACCGAILQAICTAEMVYKHRRITRQSEE
ncbi:CDP-alcohol phosphatidyltransferase family protein [Nocardia sp. NPDC127526]|uniref:CDP-alcohol phosphatidyltransferase family protein n=1 Tax=Nocardia sp. NPDC127526 TaxID=3345393 RepID=UPI00363C5830